jgi:ribosomal protein L37AE/L43A
MNKTNPKHRCPYCGKPVKKRLETCDECADSFEELM